MGEYFKPLRRKIGVLTLAMACLFTAGWIRSQTICDGIAITFTKNRYSLRSYRNQILWDHQHVDEGKLYHKLLSRFSVVIANLTQPHEDPLEKLRDRDWCLVAGEFYVAGGSAL